MNMRILQPRDWPRPRGYANGVSALGRQVYVAGQIGWNATGVLAGKDLVAQCRQALENIIAILAEDGARAEHLVRLTWFVVDREEYLSHSKELGEVYRAAMGTHYPAMSVVEVSALMEPGARVEIEATAVVPEG